MAYYESPPGMQFLHCIEFDDSVYGGESIFADTFVVAEKLRQEDPRHLTLSVAFPPPFRRATWPVKTRLK